MKNTKKDIIRQVLEIINQENLDIEECLHNAKFGDGCWITDDEYIKCGDCGRVFNSGAELAEDIISKLSKKITALLKN